MIHRAKRLVPLLALASALAFTLVAGSAAAGKKGKGEGKHFPMPAAEFKAHTEARLTKAKERLDAHIAKKQVPDAQAKEMREKLTAGIAKVNAQVEKASADGTVTKEEAKEVHAAMKEARGGHGHGKHHKRDKKA